jgi:hypothetical protein
MVAYGGELSRADAGHFIGLLDRDLPPDLENREEFLSRLRARAGNGDGRTVYMLDLMRLF